MSSRDTRPILWIKAARKAFDAFPKGARVDILEALTIAAEGKKADSAKPMKGFGSGVFEVALKYRTDACRTVYALRLGDKIGSCTPSRRRRSRASRRRKRISI